MGPSREVRSGAVFELDGKVERVSGVVGDAKEARTKRSYKITSRIDDYNVDAM